MDPIIKTYPSRSLSNDLWITMAGGIAYQKDMSKSIKYDQEYFDKYVSYEGTEIAKKINKARVSMVEEKCHCILDIGIGSGEFMKHFPKRSYGFDINEVAVDKLVAANSFIDPYHDGIPDAIDGLTFWDTLEHMRRPSDLLKKPRVGVHVFIAIPIYKDLSKVMNSKHYRPNEHFYYYTEEGLKKFMWDLGYSHLSSNEEENKAGREEILSLSFVRTAMIDPEEVIKAATAPVSPNVTDKITAPTKSEPKEKEKEKPKAQGGQAASSSKGPQGFALTSKPVK